MRWLILIYAPASALDATGSRNTTVLGGLFGAIFDLSPLVTENCEKKTQHFALLILFLWGLSTNRNLDVFFTTVVRHRPWRVAMESDLQARDRIGVQDFVLLEDFRSEDAFLENLRKRYNSGLIYVSIKSVINLGKA